MDVYGYCIRIDAREGYSDKIRMLVAVPEYESIVGVKHQGATQENPHYHLVIRTQIKEQAFRVRMKKIFNEGKGNSHMSIKFWDGSHKSYSYLFHEDGNATLIVQHNVSDEIIAEARLRNEQVQLEMAKAKERASWKLEDEVYELFANKPLTEYMDDDIAKEIILLALRSGRYMPNDYLLKSMTRKIAFRLLKGDIDKENAFAESLVRDIFHRYD